MNQYLINLLRFFDDTISGETGDPSYEYFPDSYYQKFINKFNSMERMALGGNISDSEGLSPQGNIIHSLENKTSP